MVKDREVSMDDFVRQFLLLRDGGKTARESYLLKKPVERVIPSPAFELSFNEGMEGVNTRIFQEALLAAAHSEHVYARFFFRYLSHHKMLVACNELLDGLVGPLRRKGALGHVVPLPYTDHTGLWLIQLFPVDRVAPEDTEPFSPRKLFMTLFSSGVELSDPPPEPTEH